MNNQIADRSRPTSHPPESLGLPGLNLHTVLIALRCWWKVATPLGLVLAVCAAAAVIYLTRPTYTAATLIEIRENPEIILSHAGSSDQRKWVLNQLEYLTSPMVLEVVAKIPAVFNTPELMADGDPVQSLRRRIKVRSLNGSDLFEIKFTSVSPEKAALVPQEVAQAFLSYQERTESRRFETTVNLLNDLQLKQHGILEVERERLRTITMQMKGEDPFAVRNNKQVVQIQSPVAEFQAMLVSNQLRQELLAMELNNERKHFEQQSFVPSTVEVEQYVNSSSIVGDLRKSVAEIKVKVKGHEDNGVNLKQNSVYISLTRQLTDQQALLAKTEGEVRDSAKTALEQAAKAMREQEIAGLAKELSVTQSSVQFLSDKLDKSLMNQKEYKGETLDLEFTRNEYARSSLLFEKIADKLLNIKMEREAPSRLHIAQVAALPKTPDEAIPYRNVAIFGLGAFAIPFGLAIAFELLYRRVSSRDQLESLGRVRVVGEVPALPKRARSRKGGAPELNRELQLFEESVDGLRTYLTLVESLRGMQVLAVTSAISREGKTSLAAQLAVSVASASGEATLLIDGDMRSPDIHQIFGVDCNPGLAEVLGGESPLEEAIDTDFSVNLHVLTAGQLSASPHRLLGNGEFAALIEKLRGMYRYIVIDTPPILPASEALVMARAADATVLCARRDYSRLDQVSEAHARLQAAAVTPAGVVLNGIPVRNYAQRYGSYYYNRTRLPRRPKTKETAAE